MKLRTVIDSKESLEKLMKCSLPINIAWELKKFVKSVNVELVSYEEIKNDKIIEMGEKYVDETGTEKLKVKDKNIQKFISEMNLLLDKDIESVPIQIKIKDLMEYKDVDGKGIDITTPDLMNLDWLIVE